MSAPRRRVRRSSSAARGRRPQAAPRRSTSGYSAIADEEHRRHQRVEQPAEHAAERNPEIELRQPRRRRPIVRELAVAEERHDREHARCTGITYDSGWFICAISISVRTMTASGMKRRASARAPHGRRAERDDEGERDRRQRHHPQQRNRRDVGRDIARDREQQARWHEGERHPARAPAPTRSPPRDSSDRRRRGVRCAPRRQTDAAQTSRQARRARRSRPSTGRACCLQPQRRLDDQRVGEQRGEAAQVARGVEEIRIARALIVRSPNTTSAAPPRSSTARRTAARSSEQRQQQPARPGWLGGRRPTPARARSAAPAAAAASRGRARPRGAGRRARVAPCAYA